MRVLKAAGMAGACLLAFQVPLRAGQSIVAPDGSIHAVWELHTRTVVGGTSTTGPGSRSIMYSVTDASGTRSGAISPTSDAAADSSPRLTIDAATRSPVVVWSRFDGYLFKIAYARFESGAWRDYHYVSFGSSNDTLPRIGVGRTGANLFWVADSRRFSYAPINLSRGVLTAAPRSIYMETLQAYPGRIEDDPLTGSGDSQSPSLTSDEPTALGGSDIPIVPGSTTSTQAAVWSVGANVQCADQVLVIPDTELATAYAVRLDDRTASVVKRILLPSPVPEDYGDSVSSLYLGTYCQ
jgi:hypothetical protein